MNIELIQGNCLTESDKIKDGSVDLIVTDLPYGIMQPNHNGIAYKKMYGNKLEWDTKIKTESIYKIANRILRKNGKMILFAQQPFTTELISKAIPNLPHNFNMIWEKETFGSHLKCNIAPLSYYEDILVFSKMNPKHDLELKHPIRKWLKDTQEKVGIFWNDNLLHEAYLKSGIAKNIQSAKVICQHKLDWNYVQIQKITQKHYKVLNEFFNFDKTEDEIGKIFDEYQQQHLKEQTELYGSTFNLWQGGKYKDNVFEYKRDRDNYHPTQKPVLLLEDLIKTFSNENDLVVDLTMGSGSTGVACVNTNRRFTGIEMSEQYFNIAQKRIYGADNQPKLF